MLSEDPRKATRPEHPPRTPLVALGAWLADRGAEPDLLGDAGVEVTGVSLSSRRILPGDLYAALPGARAHGADFAADALAAGAVAVLTDPAGSARLSAGTPGLVVADPRRELGGLCAEVYGHPATALALIGGTGTAATGR